MGTGYSKRKKQAKAMQEQLARMQAEMETMEVEGSAGNGLVTISMNGQGDLKDIKIKPDCVDPEDVEGLEDLIKAAFQDAQEKIQKDNPMGDLGGLGGLGGLGQGMGLPF